MKNKIKMLEKLGQTQSVHQNESVNHGFQEMELHNDAFTQLKAQNNDLVCMILPDDDDEE